MRKAILFSVLFSALPLLSQAQDDLYFTPSKAEQSAYQQAKIEAERSDYYSGIGKTDEEYNRRGQYTYKKIGVDSLGNDIFMSKVSTQHGDSVVLDTIYSGFTRKYEGYNDDFAYSRRLSRFDGFWGGYYDPWLAGRSSFYLGWGWHSPYYGYSTWYDPWYDDPFYYGYYGGYPYYSYYGRYPYYGYPYYGGYVSYNRPAGTMNHSYSSETASFPRGSFGGSRMSAGASRAAAMQDAGVRVGNRGLFGGSRSIDDRRSYDNGDNRIPSRSYNNYPSRDNYNQVPTRSYNSGGFDSGSSFGGSVHSGGGFSGGGFSGGGAGGGGFHSGGSFGGRR